MKNKQVQDKWPIVHDKWLIVDDKLLKSLEEHREFCEELVGKVMNPSTTYIIKFTNL